MAEAKKTTKKVTVKDLMHQRKDFTYKDPQSGEEFKYVIQWPGVREAFSILDNAKENGEIKQVKLWEEYLDKLVVLPQNITLDDFDTGRGYVAGLMALMEVCDNFLGDLL